MVDDEHYHKRYTPNQTTNCGVRPLGSSALAGSMTEDRQYGVFHINDGVAPPEPAGSPMPHPEAQRRGWGPIVGVIVVAPGGE